MFATTNIFQSPFINPFRAFVETLSNRFARRKLQPNAGNSSPAFTPTKEPLQPEVLREIERLELAIRQGSINA